MQTSRHISLELHNLYGKDVAERTSNCPGNEAIAKYFDGLLADVDQHSVQKHLVICLFCRNRIGLLFRLEEDVTKERLPEDLVAGARQLVNPIPVRRWTRTPALAAAAVIVLALGIVIGQQGLFSSLTPVSSPPGETRQTRNIHHVPATLQVLSPVQGDTLGSTRLELRWKGVSGSLYYDLYIMSDTGELIAQRRVENTYWLAEEPMPLAPGTEYFVQVQARMPDATTISSPPVVFTVKQQD